MINSTTLEFFTSIEMQHHRKWYSQGLTPENFCEVNWLPTFQWPRTTNTGALPQLAIYSYEDDTTTDISADAIAAGLTSDNNTLADFGYDVILFPSLLPIGTDYNIGAYHLILSDGTNTWYSEIFNMRDDISQLVKVEYWHLENFEVAEGEYLRYTAPFKHVFYFDTDVIKPQYPYTRNDSERRGKNYNKFHTTHKLWQFYGILTEGQMDALRLIPLHDRIRISWPGKSLMVEELRISPEWLNEGDIMNALFSYRANTVAVTAGRSESTTTYEPTPGSCIAGVDWNCIAFIDEDSDDFTNGTYTTGTGGTGNFVANDYALVEQIGGLNRVYQWTGSSFVLRTHAAGDVAYVAVGDVYYAGTTAAKFELPRLTGYTQITDPDTIYGTGIPGTTGLIYAVQGTFETYLGQATSTELNLGFEADIPAGTEFLRMKVATTLCGIFQQAEDFTYTPPEEATLYLVHYEDDDAADTGGVSDCGLYRLSQVNSYDGISPDNAVLYFRNTGGCDVYANDADAIAGGLSPGDVYAAAPVNDYNAPSAGGRFALVLTNGGSVTTFEGPYNSHAQAALNGVSIGQPYLVADDHELNVPSAGERALIVRTV